MGARLALALVDEQANDPHIEVATLIRLNHFSPPAREACFLCYHAKLFHYFIAAVFELANIKDLRSEGLWVKHAKFVWYGAVLGLLFFVVDRGWLLGQLKAPS